MKELVRGIKITDYCDQNNLATRDRLDLFIKVCQAVQHAHQKGIIHRDIKPSNILVTLHDGVPVPKVIDFGIAKATEGRLTDATVYTQLHQFIGTPAYMSPEQAEMSGLDIDTRSDIYSLGVLLYELLTGKTPFDAKDLLARGIDAMRKTIREKVPVRPSTRLTQDLVAADVRRLTSKSEIRNPKSEEEDGASSRRLRQEREELIHLLRGDLDWIVMKALEKDRKRRYETANGFASDIQRHLNDEPVIARPPSTAYRLQKAFRRNKLVFFAVSAVAVALIAGLSFSTWSFLRERKAHAGEAAQRRTAETARASEAEQRSKAEAGELSARRLLYTANLNLAQQAWEQPNLGRVSQLLEETENSPYRGFEWYYWQRQTHLASMTLRGHFEAVISVAVSPDGQRIVTGSEDRTAKVWETATGRELLTLKGHRGPIYSVAFSPDGQRIVTGSADKTAKVWEALSGSELLTLKGHRDAIVSVAFSPDGRRIVTGSVDKTAKVWEATAGRVLLTVTGCVVAFSPDGERIVTTCGDQAKIWDAASGRELLQLSGHNGEILSVAFSPDGQRIVTGSRDQTAKIWEAAGGPERLTLVGHSLAIESVAFSSDGQRIVTGSVDQTAKVWEAASGRELLTLKGHSGAIESAAFSPDGRRIVSGSQDKTAKLWDSTNTGELLTLNGHAGQMWSVAFSPDGERIVTGNYDKTATVWESAAGRELVTLKGGHTAPVRSAVFSPDGQRIVTGSSDSTARIWDAANGQELLPLNGHTGVIESAAFSRDGQRIVTASRDKTAKVWEASSGKELLTLRGHSGWVMEAAFSQGGRRIATGSLDKTAKVWDAANGRELLTFRGHSAPIYCLAFSPDGQRIVTGGEDNTGKVWETASGQLLLTLQGHSDLLEGVAFSPDGQRIVTGSWDRTAKLWELVTGREVLTLKGHSGPVLSVAFSPDGQRIVTGSYDQTARVWQAAPPKQVAAWEEVESAAKEKLAALQREWSAEQERENIARTRDEGRIKRWLILSPIALATGQSRAEGLDVEQIEGEARLRPTAGETMSTANGELRWREVTLRDYEDYVIDFNALVGHPTTQSVAYAVCYIQSEAEQRGLQMWVGSVDGAKVYLNGRLVHKYAFGREFIADQDTVPDIALNAGLNVLVFKVVNKMEDWKGSIRLIDAQGDPVKGIKVTLTP